MLGIYKVLYRAGLDCLDWLGGSDGWILLDDGYGMMDVAIVATAQSWHEYVCTCFGVLYFL